MCSPLLFLSLHLVQGVLFRGLRVFRFSHSTRLALPNFLPCFRRRCMSHSLRLQSLYSYISRVRDRRGRSIDVLDVVEQKERADSYTSNDLTPAPRAIPPLSFLTVPPCSL